MKLWHCIGRGKGTWYASGINSRSMYASLDAYVEAAFEGALVYDATSVSDVVWAKHIRKAPIVDHTLPPWGVDKIYQEDVATLAMAIDDPQATNLRSLDRVGINHHERLLRSVPGIRVGRVVGGQIDWENAEEMADTSRD